MAGEEMAAGVYCAEFTMQGAGGIGTLPAVGVVGAGFDVAREKQALSSANGWMLSPGSGNLYHNGEPSDWAGSAAANQLKVGDVVVRSLAPPPLCPVGCWRLTLCA